MYLVSLCESTLCVPGDGQFGKVYAAVNMKTGELMALKEVNTNISIYIYIHIRERLFIRT